jgi:RNA polymerase sigma-70 factor, ECF subfamily
LNDNPWHITPEQLAEESRWIEASRRDTSAFAPLYNRYYQRILGFIYNRVEEKEMAFELTSQVFYKALSKLSSYKYTGVPFSAWLFRIASNEVNDMYRSGKSKRVVVVNENTLQDLQESVDESHLTDAELFKALQTLPEEEMQLIEMRFFEKRPFAEVADILGITESAAKQRLYKILEKLKKAFLIH